jgi:hypothetical protein
MLFVSTIVIVQGTDWSQFAAVVGGILVGLAGIVFAAWEAVRKSRAQRRGQLRECILAFLATARLVTTEARVYRSAIERSDDDAKNAAIGRLKEHSDQMARQRASLDLLLDPKTRSEILTAADGLRDACSKVVTRAAGKTVDLEDPIGNVTTAMEGLLSAVRKDLPPAFK